MTKFDYYWQSNEEWVHQLEDGRFVLNDDAPEEAIESYRNYVQQKIAYAHRKQDYIKQIEAENRSQ